MAILIISLFALIGCNGGGGGGDSQSNNDISGNWVGTCGEGYSATFIATKEGSFTYSDSNGGSSIGTYIYEGGDSIIYIVTETNGQGCSTSQIGQGNCSIDLSGNSLTFFDCVGGTYTRSDDGGSSTDWDEGRVYEGTGTYLYDENSGILTLQYSYYWDDNHIDEDGNENKDETYAVSNITATKMNWLRQDAIEYVMYLDRENGTVNDIGSILGTWEVDIVDLWDIDNPDDPSYETFIFYANGSLYYEGFTYWKHICYTCLH